MLSNILEKFVQDSLIAVMAQALMTNISMPFKIILWIQAKCKI
ncbi:hypothetical protein [Geminocystis herdmanii]|nr:hypothetical protein [Geminocystis herdmanii]